MEPGRRIYRLPDGSPYDPKANVQAGYDFLAQLDAERQASDQQAAMDNLRQNAFRSRRGGAMDASPISQALRMFGR